MIDHVDQLNRIELAIARIEHSLYIGNGVPPVLSRLTSLEATGAASKRFVALVVSVAGVLVTAVDLISRRVWP